MSGYCSLPGVSKGGFAKPPFVAAGWDCKGRDTIESVPPLLALCFLSGDAERKSRRGAKLCFVCYLHSPLVSLMAPSDWASVRFWAKITSSTS